MNFHEIEKAIFSSVLAIVRRNCELVITSLALTVGVGLGFFMSFAYSSSELSRVCPGMAIELPTICLLAELAWLRRLSAAIIVFTLYFGLPSLERNLIGNNVWSFRVSNLFVISTLASAAFFIFYRPL